MPPPPCSFEAPHADSSGTPVSVCDYSLITRENAQIASHNLYRGVAVGGHLSDMTPFESTAIGGASFANSIAFPNLFNFANGVTRGQGMPFDWNHFEYLATTLSPQTQRTGFDGTEVHVVCSGGTYDFGQFCYQCPDGHDSPGGRNILVVFTTSEQVRIAGTADGRQWFGSILAPFAEVVVDGSVGFVDGVIIARSYREESAGSVQLHGNCFQGTDGGTSSSGSLLCGSNFCGGPTVGGSSSSTPSCSDTWKAKKCSKKSRKGKCRKRRVRRQCVQTCGLCPVG